MLGFIEDILGASLWSKQQEIVRSVEAFPRTSVRSCHGIGKSFIASRIAVAFLYCRPNSVVITTAPTARQVKEILWREIGDCVAKSSLPGRCLTTQLELGPRWFAKGLATDDPDKFQGFHARDLLLIVDEAAGVSREIFAAADGILTSAGARCLLIGNPTTTEGRFFDTHHKLRGAWNCIEVSAFESPNFTAEGQALPAGATDCLVSPQWVENAEEEWGAESPLYIAKVLGRFPDVSEDGLISLQWVEAATRSEQVPVGEVVMGIDVARQGNCETCFYVAKGDGLIACEAWKKADFNHSAGRILNACIEFKVKRLRVDATGMGVGLVDVLKPETQKRGIQIEEVFVGQPARDRKRFALLRDELWWEVRQKLKDGRAFGFIDERTKGQLVSVKYKFNSHGQILIESKDDMTKRGLVSPDRADALCLAIGKRPQKALGW